MSFGNLHFPNLGQRKELIFLNNPIKTTDGNMDRQGNKILERTYYESITVHEIKH